MAIWKARLRSVRSKYVFHQIFKHRQSEPSNLRKKKTAEAERVQELANRAQDLEKELEQATEKNSLLERFEAELAVIKKEQEAAKARQKKTGFMAWFLSKPE